MLVFDMKIIWVKMIIG